MAVIDGTSRLRKVLMCRPDFLVSAAPINVISEQYTKPLDHDKMMQEYGAVVKAYQDNGVEVVQVTSGKKMPNAVFARDFGGDVKEGYILGRFKKPIRFEERRHYEDIMAGLGIPKIAEVTEGYFEGGDFAFIDEKTLAIGVIDRTNLTGVDEIRKQLEPYGYKVYAVKANPDYLHLDMCFNLVAPKLAIAYEAGLPEDFVTLVKEKGIKIIGDMPIYISADSVEVWTMPELFKVDAEKNPLCIAGVPADSFSDDGQLWGNPIYDWENHKKTNYAWWVYRIKEGIKLYDLLRIDHFKGFSDYWEIRGDYETANDGSWQPGPGRALFDVVRDELGELPIIAENLGYIDAKAEQLLTDTAFPGMKILEFGFYDTEGKSIDAPHNCNKNSVAYNGTHDNEVVNGWYDNLTDEQKAFVDAYTHRHEGEPITQTMLRTLFATVSDIAIATMQDILDKPAESRMNIPNTVGGNWQWRMLKEDLTDERKAFLKDITALYCRKNTFK